MPPPTPSPPPTPTRAPPSSPVPTPTRVPPPSPVPTPIRVLPPVAYSTWWSKQMQLGCTDRAEVSFGSPPLRMEHIVNVAPYGLMVGAHVIPSDHQGYSFPQQQSSPVYDVLTVGDGEIVDITVRNVSVETGRPSSPQYHVTIRHSCSIITQYDLIDVMEPSIEAQREGVRQGRPAPVREGQVIGKSGYSTQGIDLWVADLRTLTPGYVVTEHYTAEPWRLYAIEPFSLFREPLRSELRAKSIRRAEPRGGLADMDVDGRLAGGWFVESTNGYAGRSQRDFFTTHLAITYHAYDPTAVIVSTGSFDGRPRQFAVRGNGPDPAQVSVGTGPVKYELLYWGYFVGDSGRGWDYKAPVDNLRVLPFGETQGTLLVQMVDGRKLKVEAFPGRLLSQVTGFTEAAVMYER